MKLFLPAYSQGHHQISEAIEPGEIELNSSQFSRPLEIKIQFDRNDPYVRLDYSVQTWVQRICDRCLEDYDFLLNTEGRLIFVLGRASQQGDMDEDEIRYIPADIQDIDLSVDLRDALMLVLPVKSLCSENCKGICPHCGRNLNEGLCRCSR